MCASDNPGVWVVLSVPFQTLTMKGLFNSCLTVPCLLLLLSLPRGSEAVPISIDKTKVKVPEETVEPPQSVVRP